jgi:hypothetical protein
MSGRPCPDLLLAPHRHLALGPTVDERPAHGLDHLDHPGGDHALPQSRIQLRKRDTGPLVGDGAPAVEIGHRAARRLAQPSQGDRARRGATRQFQPHPDRAEERRIAGTTETFADELAARGIRLTRNHS